MHVVPLIISYIYTPQFADSTEVGGITDMLEGRGTTVHG